MTALGDSVQISEGGQASEGVWLREDEGELEGAGGDGEEGGPTKCFQMGVRSCGGWTHRCCVHRKALEMSCAIQNQLARILAEFEMALERDVLQPLSRLSEVTLRTPPSPAPPSIPSPLTPPPSPCLPPGGASSHPQAQEKPAEAGIRLEHPQEQVGARAPGWGAHLGQPTDVAAEPTLRGHGRAHWVQCVHTCTHLVSVNMCVHVLMPAEGDPKS